MSLMQVACTPDSAVNKLAQLHSLSEHRGSRAGAFATKETLTYAPPGKVIGEELTINQYQEDSRVYIDVESSKYLTGISIFDAIAYCFDLALERGSFEQSRT